MCLDLTPDLPDKPPPPPPPPAEGARRLFEPTQPVDDDTAAEGLGLNQLRVRPPQVGV